MVKLPDLPELPGIYFMKKADKTIYVGKAKNLKKRVSSYFNRNHSDTKTIELVRNIEKVEFMIAKSEVDALILENNFIKKYKPKYNILLKDQKTYPYIKLTREKFPRISITRSLKEVNSKNAETFGPYPSGGFYLLKNLIKTFKIRDCKRDMDKTYDRPCLKYFLNMCLGPCKYKNVDKEYSLNVDGAKEILRGNGKPFLVELEAKMQKFSEEMNFERAIIYREQIKNVKKALIDQISENLNPIDEDIFVLKNEGGNLFVLMLNVREGKVIGMNNFKLKLSDIIEENVFEQIVTNYYSKNFIPKNIIFDSKYEENKELLSQWFKIQNKSKVNLYFPQVKSRRKELLEMAYLNLDKEIKKYFNQKSVLEDGLMKIYQTLNLRKYPRKIECFDISNIQGKDAVASMSVSVEGKASKKNYRKFKIKTKDTPDDFHMMREVITRRYSKLPEHEFPDLILIDGGLGQLNATGGILEELEKEHLVDLISIAKREEEIFKFGESDPYIFSKSDEALKILQRLRDEAHRFGVTYHRVLRSKRVLTSELDKVSGIGKKRKEILLKEFGSIKKVKEASLDELKKYVPTNVAEKIKELSYGE